MPPSAVSEKGLNTMATASPTHMVTTRAESPTRRPMAPKPRASAAPGGSGDRPQQAPEPKCNPTWTEMRRGEARVSQLGFPRA